MAGRRAMNLPARDAAEQFAVRTRVAHGAVEVTELPV